MEFIFGKALVKSTTSGDIFEGIEPGTISLDSTIGYRPDSLSEMSIKVGDPWAFYHQFWTAQGMEQLKDWVEPRIRVRFADSVTVTLLLANDTAMDQEITLVSHVPNGWTEAGRPSRFQVKAQDICPIEVVVTAPAKQAQNSSVLRWDAMHDQTLIGSASVRVYPGYPYLPR